MAVEERVFIAGAGPVGLVAAANLLRHGVPVTVFEAGPDLSEESRASTFHPPTLDMLDQLGAAKPLIAQGLIAPKFQYRTKQDGLLAQFDFAAIADVTQHPYRVQSEQSKLTRILYEQLRGDPNFSIEFDAKLVDVTQDGAAVQVALERGGRQENRSGRWLIGADGARSEVRRALGISFEGFTWPERFLVVSTPFDFRALIPDLVSVNYVADPQRWHFFLEIPGLWRVMFPVAEQESDEQALSPAFGQALLSGTISGVTRFEIAHTTLYNVHQRVAGSFRLGRAFLAGDAAHINNPLGGMGMNGGIHDAMNLTQLLADVWHDRKPQSELDRYDRQRRGVTKEYIESQSIQNKRNLEGAGEFKHQLRHIATDPARTRDYLLRVAMIDSLRRAKELG
ncbi:MAG: 3-(3-hydroxy-phenyl)propionate hydroxylase [Alphaproteobacteria bacterium]|nr:3-(3-hydroxy-phenyl)propionate hydroxylase [Alphaproteobacteria bacterium]